MVEALVRALEVPLEASSSFDIPGPDALSGKEILERIAAIEGRTIPSVSLPWLTPRLSAMWLRLVTRAEFAVARELVFGLTEDLLPRDERYWDLIDYRPAFSFDAAARRALLRERATTPTGGRLASAEESLVRRFGFELDK